MAYLKSVSRSEERPVRQVRFVSEPEVVAEDETYNSDMDWEDVEEEDASIHTASPVKYQSPKSILINRKLQSPPPSTTTQAIRLAALAFFIAIFVPLISRSGHPLLGVNARVIHGPYSKEALNSNELVKRQDTTDTNVCKRWSHQSAVVNGTLYVFGGRATTDASQTANTWTNNFLSLDLTKDWQTGSPALTGLARPNGPPAVSNGFMWNSMTQLFLYGGEYSDNPDATPDPFSLWEYNIPQNRWYEHQNPTTSAGDNAGNGGQQVQRSAEGAGVNIPEIGRGFYFGGHLDSYTTPGWTKWFPRVYLKSMIEFTFPGYQNNGVNDLKTDKPAGTDGVWRNITEGGLQDQAGFTERADGLLVYVPGFGPEGILLGLAGGTNATFTQMNVIDVYDIATSNWYKQATTGTTPQYRVNPCAVVAAAADGSSYNVYMFGGQNLVPYGQQVQYDDMWILTVPAFTWIKVNQDNQSVPPARAGHTCHLWDGQMIVVGGYVGQDLSCDSPGIYVFDASKLEWQTSFASLSGGNNGQGDDSNPLSQQQSQKGNSSGLAGSYGYAVPAAVQSVIGGQATGGATITAPVQSPTSGPLATGRPVTYTVTGANGEPTTTVVPGSPTDPNAISNNGSSGPNIGAIVAGVVAGIFFLIALYFAFCAWVYRKQLKLYKNHVALANRREMEKDATSAFIPAVGVPPGSSGKASSARAGPKTSSEGSATGGSGLGSGSASTPYGAGGVAADGGPLGRSSTANSSTDDLLAGQEPSFWGFNGVFLNPRRSLKVINRD